MNWLSVICHFRFRKIRNNGTCKDFVKLLGIIYRPIPECDWPKRTAMYGLKRGETLSFLVDSWRCLLGDGDESHNIPLLWPTEALLLRINRESRKMVFPLWYFKSGCKHSVVYKDGRGVYLTWLGHDHHVYIHIYGNKQLYYI